MTATVFSSATCLICSFARISYFPLEQYDPMYRSMRRCIVPVQYAPPLIIISGEDYVQRPNKWTRVIPLWWKLEVLPDSGCLGNPETFLYKYFTDRESATNGAKKHQIYLSMLRFFTRNSDKKKYFWGLFGLFVHSLWTFCYHNSNLWNIHSSPLERPANDSSRQIKICYLNMCVFMGSFCPKTLSCFFNFGESGRVHSACECDFSILNVAWKGLI